MVWLSSSGDACKVLSHYRATSRKSRRIPSAEGGQVPAGVGRLSLKNPYHSLQDIYHSEVHIGCVPVHQFETHPLTVRLICTPDAGPSTVSTVIPSILADCI